MGSVCSKLVQLMLSKEGGAVNINNTKVIDLITIMLSLIVVLHRFGSGHGACALRFVSETIPINSYEQELVVLYVGTERPELTLIRLPQRQWK
jgi:hypothetical protein